MWISFSAAAKKKLISQFRQSRQNFSEVVFFIPYLWKFQNMTQEFATEKRVIILTIAMVFLKNTFDQLDFISKFCLFKVIHQCFRLPILAVL